MNLWNAFILGIIEGITEFLPISSTGHLILSSKLLGLSQTEFMKTFEIAVQLGAILAVIVLYPRRLFVEKESIRRIAAAFIPTAIIGFFLYKIIKGVLFAHDQIILWAMFLGGIFIIIFDLIHRENDDATDQIRNIPIKKAVLIGIFQALAVIPGVSRSAATIIGGLILGIKRTTIVEFSFLLAVPTMLCATLLDMIKNAPQFSNDQTIFLAVGFVTSFAVAIMSIKFLLNFIKRHNFIIFGVYRILIAIIGWFVFY